jgi:hypothetical protein
VTLGSEFGVTRARPAGFIRLIYIEPALPFRFRENSRAFFPLGRVRTDKMTGS